MWQRNRKQIGLALTATLVVGAGTLIFTADWGGNGKTDTFEGNGSVKIHTAATTTDPVETKRGVHRSAGTKENVRRNARSHDREKKDGRKGPRSHQDPVIKKAKKKPSAA